MSAFVHTRLATGAYKWQRRPVPVMDPTGFDTASARVCFRGTAAQLVAAFPVGATAAATDYSAPAGSNLYCMGPQGQSEEKFGHVIAEISWKGYIVNPTLAAFAVTPAAGQHIRTVSMGRTTTESTWPQDRDGNTVYLGGPYSPTPALRSLTVAGPAGPITYAYAPYRVRLIGRAYTCTVGGIIVGNRAALFKPPVCNIPDPTVGDGTVNWSTVPDPQITYSADNQGRDGWVCRNYQPSVEHAMGDKILARFQADYEWVERYGP